MNSSDHRAHLLAPSPAPAEDGRRAGRGQLAGVGAILAAACLWAANGAVSKIVLASGMSSLRLVEIRCAAAAVVLLAIAAARRPAALRIARDELAFVAVYGVIGLAMVQWLYLVAIARMPVSISLLIEFTAPLMVAMWVRFVRRQPVRQRVWVALALCVGGLALVGRVWAGLTLDGLGLACAGLAALCLAAYYMLGERALGRRDPLTLAAWSFAAAAVFWSALLPWWSFPFARLASAMSADAVPAGWLHDARLPVWTLLAWVVVMGTVVPFALMLTGLQRVGATRTGLVGTAEPVLAGAVAWLLIGERLSATQIAGGAVVLAGIVIAETARGLSEPPAIPET